MNISLATLAVVFLLIAARRIGHLRIGIWQAMAAGAGVVLATGQISPADAWKAIDLDVMIFLAGMFIVGQALIASGYLYQCASRILHRARSVDGLVLSVLFVGGAASALLMNDTLAIVGTPLMVRLAREHRVDPKLLLLTLAFAVTIGSVPSPIGNPQNLLIAIKGEVANPFVTFIVQLGLPSLLALLLAYGILRLFFRREFHRNELVHAVPEPVDPHLTHLVKAALVLMLGLIVLKVASVAIGMGELIRLSHIAVAAAAPLLLFSPKRGKLLRDMDWRTLIFFAAMFVLMASVWQSGVVQTQLNTVQIDLTTTGSVLSVSVLASQVISNVPLVGLYLPVLQHAGATDATLLALAAGSTLAGNLLLLGAASNIIIVQNAEKHGLTLTFWDFAKVGAPLTLVSVALFVPFLS